MIQANETRIGNWISPEHDLDGRYHQVVSLEPGVINRHVESWYSPIPLTPEILLACGFENMQGDYWMENDDLMLALDRGWWWTNSWEMDGEFGFEPLADYREIEHLHQLQNLYFALTGTELNVQL